MKNKTDIFMQAVSEYSNAILAPQEQFAAYSLIQPELQRQQVTGKLSPFVCMVHSNPGLDSESFLLLFCVSYIPEGRTYVQYEYIRAARLSQEEFLDWLLVTNDLLDSKLKTVCFTN